MTTGPGSTTAPRSARWRPVAGALVGAGAGYAYYALVGCSSGCWYQSSPLAMPVIGAVLGVLAVGR